MTVTDIVAAIALLGGALMSLLAGVAVVRFPDVMSRIHAATKPQVLGIMLLMLAVGLRIGSTAVIGLLVLIVVLQFVTAPVSAHLVVRAAYKKATRASEDDLPVPADPTFGGATRPPAHDTTGYGPTSADAPIPQVRASSQGRKSNGGKPTKQDPTSTR